LERRVKSGKKLNYKHRKEILVLRFKQKQSILTTFFNLFFINQQIGLKTPGKISHNDQE